MSVQLIDGPNSVTVDAVMSETHSYGSKVSTFPVEDGGTVTDHIVNDPPSVTVTGIVSATPVTKAPTGTEVQDALTALLAIRDARRPVTLITGLRRYSDMALKSLSFPGVASPKDAVGGALNFTAEFQKVQLVSVKTASVPARARVRGDSGKAKAKAGKQKTVPASGSAAGKGAGAEGATKQVEQRSRSTLKGLRDGLGKALGG